MMMFMLILKSFLKKIYSYPATSSWTWLIGWASGVPGNAVVEEVLPIYNGVMCSIRWCSILHDSGHMELT